MMKKIDEIPRYLVVCNHITGGVKTLIDRSAHSTLHVLIHPNTPPIVLYDIVRNTRFSDAPKVYADVTVMDVIPVDGQSSYAIETRSIGRDGYFISDEFVSNDLGITGALNQYAANRYVGELAVLYNTRDALTVGFLYAITSKSEKDLGTAVNLIRRPNHQDIFPLIRSERESWFCT